MRDNDLSNSLQEEVASACQKHQPLSIVGGNTKSFYGRKVEGMPLCLAGHTGVIRYEPTELYITARAGTLLDDIETLLAEHRQMLPFEPPHFGKIATLGGAVASGLAGPRRSSAGAVRDSILGVTILNGKGQLLKFGGEVMKNVAGYDLSRLMAGSLGTLGVLLEVSIKLLPVPLTNMTFVQTATQENALAFMRQWSRRPLPITASYFEDGQLAVRLSGSENTIQGTAKIIQGELLNDGDAFWQHIREHEQPFFKTDMPVWRLSVPPATEKLGLSGANAIEWNGALRWLISDADPQQIRSSAERCGGQASLFKNPQQIDSVFHPLSSTAMRLHQKLKHALDPNGILNPGRMYAEL